MKYTFSFDGDGKIVLESRAGESDRHIALKILSYLLFRDETGGLPLVIEQGVGQRHKPDLVATDPETGRVVLWIDCGQIEVKRLGRIAVANRHARVVVVKATENEARLYARAAERHLSPPARGASVSYLGFDEDFFDAFRLGLRGTNDLAIERDGDTLRVTINCATQLTRLYLFHAPTAASPRAAR